MSQFLGLAIFLTIVGSLALHAGMELPWCVQWIGRLPGDIIITKESLAIYMPLASSLIISAALSVGFSFFSQK